MFDKVGCSIYPVINSTWRCSEDLNFSVFVVNDYGDHRHICHPLSQLIEGPECSDTDDEIFYRRGAIVPVVIRSSQRRRDLCHRGSMEVQLDNGKYSRRSPHISGRSRDWLRRTDLSNFTVHWFGSSASGGVKPIMPHRLLHGRFFLRRGASCDKGR
jgi:hypothetical protein